jgi:alpha-beta hydrolase superfamily lysophospholipase
MPKMGRMSSDPTAVFTPSARVRGTLALIAGRDETAAIYRRFGSRISADGYTVGVFEGPDAAAAVAWLGDQPDSPRVLVGSDTGASAVLTALAQGDIADAAIVAGVVVDVERTPTDAERTACPVHLGVLAEQHAATAPVLDDDLAARLPESADLAAISVPVLAVQGGSDPVSPIAQALAVLSSIPDVEVIETVDGLHDALNDQTHRSVAASIVLWLERLRTGDVHAPIVRSAENVNA